MAKLQEEGIENVDDLDMDNKDFFKQLIDHLKTPGGQISYVGAMVVTPSFNFSAKSNIRLEAASIFL